MFVFAVDDVVAVAVEGAEGRADTVEATEGRADTVDVDEPVR